MCLIRTPVKVQTKIFFFKTRFLAHGTIWYPNGIFSNRYVGCGNVSCESKYIALAIVPVNHKHRGGPWTSILSLTGTLARDNQDLGGVTEAQTITGQAGSWWEELARALSQSSRDLPPGLAFAHSVCGLGHITSVTTSMETSLLAWSHLFLLLKILIGGGGGGENFQISYFPLALLSSLGSSASTFGKELRASWMGVSNRMKLKYAKPTWWHTPVIPALQRWRQEN